MPPFIASVFLIILDPNTALAFPKFKGAINFERDITSEKINFKTPSSEERKIFEDLINRLRSQAESADAETIQTEIYQIGKDHNFENLRDWFKLIYQVLFGKEDGPRFGTFIAIYGIKQKGIILTIHLGNIPHQP